MMGSFYNRDCLLGRGTYIHFEVGYLFTVRHVLDVCWPEQELFEEAECLAVYEDVLHDRDMFLYSIFTHYFGASPTYMLVDRYDLKI